jgi:adenylate cyclase
VTSSSRALLHCGAAAGVIMAIEIERKFLVRGEDWRRFVTAHTDIRQGYLSSGGYSSTRVRINDGKAATLTVKSKRAELRRVEVECAIAVADAEALLMLRESSLISKVRHHVPWGNHIWEVDEFHGDNEGLVIAEVELHNDSESFDRPPWLGVEVTGQPQYYNSSLASRPYSSWSVPLGLHANTL